MPWTYDNPPAVAENWTEAERRRCVDAANAVLEGGGSDEEAIYACIAAAGKARVHYGQGGAMARKTFHAPIVLKEDGEDGTFKSVFAQFNVIDHDGDVTQPGAFRDGAETVVEGWNHDWGLPVGKGVIHSNEREAWIEGKFFLDTAQGKDHYLTLKNLEGLEEWSYTFDIEAAEAGEFDGERVRFLKRLDVWGVAPVTRGAGIGTRTVTLKAAPQLTEDEIVRLKALACDGAKGAIGSHSTPTTDAAWDGPANETRVRSGEDLAYYRRIYAWRDPDGDPEVKSTYKFIHHMVDGDGNPGAANIRACQTGIGVLNGGRGGTTIPDADRKGVYNHLAKHLRDADVEPPELKIRGSDSEGGEGEVGTDGEPSGDDKPSGVPPSVIGIQIDIMQLEE
jgi:HK97 family phage prohead protease